MNKCLKFALLATAMVASHALAQEVSTASVGKEPSSPGPLGPVPVSKQAVNDNWVNGAGDAVWSNSTGEHCWRSSGWTPATANKACDGALVEAPPPPAPVPVVPVVPAPGEKVTFRAETQFDFDKVVLKPEGKEALDKLAEQVKGVEDLEVVVVSGYTDEIGADTYNFNLSRQRAESVKAYLVSRGIDENHIYTEGKGKSNPVITDCRHKFPKVSGKFRKAFIACLAPNRRVEIEAVGSVTVNRAASTPDTSAQGYQPAQ